MHRSAWQGDRPTTNAAVLVLAKANPVAVLSNSVAMENSYRWLPFDPQRSKA